jgi:hypothetical protein
MASKRTFLKAEADYEIGEKGVRSVEKRDGKNPGSLRPIFYRMTLKFLLGFGDILSMNHCGKLWFWLS